MFVDYFHGLTGNALLPNTANDRVESCAAFFYITNATETTKHFNPSDH